MDLESCLHNRNAGRRRDFANSRPAASHGVCVYKFQSVWECACCAAERDWRIKRTPCGAVCYCAARAAAAAHKLREIGVSITGCP
jgi:hypothetical protein